MRTWQPGDGNEEQGIRGYFEANKRGLLQDGAGSVIFIKRFFDISGWTLLNTQPADDLVGNEPYSVKCLRSDDSTYFFIYVANPTSTAVSAANAHGSNVPDVNMFLQAGTYWCQIYNPRTGDKLINL